LRTLRDLAEWFGDRNVAIARELTKKFEEVVRGRLSEVQRTLENKKLRGEYVIVVEGERNSRAP
jgi:16S rRNA (cytidine1402-2'-O)-methyltransferase